jgi:hypothetical protein
MKLIGINGFKTSGKDTTYLLLRQLFTGEDASERVERRAFADSLKIMAARALGFEGSDDHLIGMMNDLKEGGDVTTQFRKGEAQDGRPYTISGREYLQLFGEKARTTFGDTFWVDQVVPLDGWAFSAVWETEGRRGPNIGLPALGCITDVRYENEAARVKQMGGVVWEIVRPGLESDGHSSEVPLPRRLIDTVIINDGTIEELDDKVREAVSELE